MDDPLYSSSTWLCAQVGAREHYSVPRALHKAGVLEGLFTDSWVPPTSLRAHLISSQRFKSRYHADLDNARVHSPKLRSLILESSSRCLRRPTGWQLTIARNNLFQQWVSSRFKSIRLHQIPAEQSPLVNVFSYSYAARSIFQQARDRGWRCVLGQIDPGPSHEQLVASEHQRYPCYNSAWEPPPPSYWQCWSDEISLADYIVVNSAWSWRCLLQQGVPEQKLCLIPLVYEEPVHLDLLLPQAPCKQSEFQLLFLGRISLAKGIGRLLDAMRILEHHAVKLTLVGPTELDPQSWATTSNIHWLGSLPRSQVAQVYRQSHAMILPTLSDGFALTQLEALANNCPVIASQFCGEVVTSGLNGWILPSVEPDVIAATIREAMATAHLLPRPLYQPTFGIADLASSLQQLGSFTSSV